MEEATQEKSTQQYRPAFFNKSIRLLSIQWAETDGYLCYIRAITEETDVEKFKQEMACGETFPELMTLEEIREGVAQDPSARLGKDVRVCLGLELIDQERQKVRFEPPIVIHPSS